MYHPGKVIEIFSPKDRNVKAADNTIQALLEMWDENLITVLVENALSKDLKKGDIVLVDYRPLQGTPAPKLTVIKILRGSPAKETWNMYKEHLKGMKTKPRSQQIQKPVVPMQPQDQHYVG